MQIIVIPGKEGPMGGVVVRQGAQTLTLEKPYAGARLRSDGAPFPITSSQEGVHTHFSAALSALPPRPTTYLIYFVSGTDTLTPESARQIEEIVAELVMRPAPEFAVIGHTDSVGTETFNDALSLKRANRIAQILISHGIPEVSISVADRGEREPLVLSADNVPEPKNRRVEIVVR
ncbi:MAG: OmpA family protein [Burkholderiales bacterium]